MSTLRFTTDLKSREMPTRDLPVEVRRLDLSVARRGVISDKFKVNPGIYIAISRLPGGQALSAQVTAKKGEDREVELRLAPAYRTLDRDEELPVLVWGYEDPGVEFADSEGGSAPISPQVVARDGLRAFVRSTRFADYVPTDDPSEPAVRAAGAVIRVQYPHSHPLELVQVWQPGHPNQHIVLPPQEPLAGLDNAGYEIVLTPVQDGSVDATAHLEHRLADTMLQYSGRGLLTEADAVADSMASHAEGLLEAKRASPLAAAAAAYVLLRLGALDRLHDWTENLYQWFPWLADGAVIRAEHLARKARHQEATRCLLELESRGLPIFSDGLGYAVQRLEFYISMSDASTASSLARLHHELVPFSLATDFSKAFTTYTGGDPNHPGPAPAEVAASAPYGETHTKSGELVVA